MHPVLDVEPPLASLPGFHDPFSAITHLVGALGFLIWGFYLVRRGRGDLARQIALGMYAFTTILLLSLSGVYHQMERDGTARAVMARLDHNAIFLLIAGTFTPAHIILFRGWARWGPLAIIWLAAINGVVFKSIFFDDFNEGFGLAFYLVMGWFGLVSGGMIAWRFGWRSVNLLFWGGVAYTVGAAFDFARWPILVLHVVHSHEIFHVAILIGAGLHWLWVWRITTSAAIARHRRGK